MNDNGSWQITSGILDAAFILGMGVIAFAIIAKYYVLILAGVAILGCFAGVAYGLGKLTLRFERNFPGWGKVLFIGTVIAAAVLGVWKR